MSLTPRAVAIPALGWRLRHSIMKDRFLRANHSVSYAIRCQRTVDATGGRHENDSEGTAILAKTRVERTFIVPNDRQELGGGMALTTRWVGREPKGDDRWDSWHR